MVFASTQFNLYKINTDNKAFEHTMRSYTIIVAKGSTFQWKEHLQKLEHCEVLVLLDNIIKKSYCTFKNTQIIRRLNIQVWDGASKRI